MGTFKIQSSAIALAVLLSHVAAVGQNVDRTEVNRSFGTFVLDVMDASAKPESVSTNSVARTIAERSIEIRRDWTGDGAVTPAEDDWYKHKDGDDKWDGEKPGGGPPPWAPAHGYRRNFGAEQQQDLGHYVHQRVQEGLHGSDLIVAIRRKIDEISSGGDVGDPRERANRHKEAENADDYEIEVEDDRGGPPPSRGANQAKGKGKSESAGSRSKK